MATPSYPESVVRIPVHHSGVVIAHAIVDQCDAYLAQYRWYDMHGYACRSCGYGAALRMHREILGLDRGDPRQGDHINRNTLDNRRSNLRITDRFGNAQNKPLRKDNTSGFPGVTFRSDRNMWRAQVNYRGRRHALGDYRTAEHAGAAVAAKRAELGFLGDTPCQPSP